ncbi:hypothetical protein [Saccharospirillum impatiens]|uniref:hypothetical protein n=1 Tax=Saccharospirillum impatiens TaxID=169438 RepID=UPI0003FFAFCA|nr:hypothetical protein [Saccharospirillum impatiens]
MKPNRAKAWPALVFLIVGATLSATLVAWMLLYDPWPLFSEQGRWLSSQVWGQISLFDLYSGFFIALALAWLFEPNPWVRVLLLVTLPTLGNPVLAIWCVTRWQHLKRMAASAGFD